MRFLDKAFECQTSLSLEQCKAKILREFPKRGAIASSGILLNSLSEEDDSISFSLMQSSIRGFYVKLNANISIQNSKTQIVGSAYVSNLALLLLIYFLVITFILVFVFSAIVWLSLFFLIVFGTMVFFAINTFRNLGQIIKVACVH